MRVFSYQLNGKFTRLYQNILQTLIEAPDYKTAPRGLPIREIINCSVIVDPNDCHIDFTQTGAPDRQSVYDKYCEEELKWYQSGNTLASSAPSKFWNQLAGPDGHITSNYGHMMLFDKKYPTVAPGEIQVLDEMQTAFDRVVETLKNDPDSRQAIMHYNEPRHCYPTNKDFPCTLTGQFFLRNGKLSFTVVQRSCDIIRGYSYDCPWQCYLMDLVMDKLIQAGMKVELGTFTHVIGSLHLYESHLELAKRIIARPEV